MVPGLTLFSMSDANRLREQEHSYGFWCVTGNPSVVDAAASVGPDFIVIDTQHGIDLAQVDTSLFTVMAHYGVAGLVRVPAIGVAAIGRALDLGAAGIIIPLVESAADAKRAVGATRYAPEGGRSFGMQTRRVGPFDEPPFVALQVETEGAVEEIEAIAAVDGVDALYIGPADLGLGLGGEPAPDVNAVFDATHPNASRLREAFGVVVAAAQANGIIAGIHVGDGETAARARIEGFRFSSVSVDVGLVASGLATELAAARH
jgi:4-hydroxy-2-oxoheptanedioate aldolase